ncbi:ACP S-malonyltransferase [Engelhardtia mirabilis]|uniref:[acyl-carrier-protein] S-malonyltransferase n=1 Tax=Engelhardtia mirabilis TaxID=2528011 RepID=A0A518BRE0_9BACT|nr:Malonyl CoA-acyl carrier protein transacylase [Planctomycetes bacterium Pla133]QDV03870.1 Malonyl CoA-acyl carrier protein transacylase [Planctomycetes bacterium Pla86]
MTRSFIICPGRGSYTERSLKSLPEGHAWVAAAERLRAEADLPPLVELDRAERFSAAQHLRPANVSALIYLVSMLDASQAMARTRPTCVAGNSMGWYTALAAAGALSFEDGFRLVQEMALLQEQHDVGGQILYPVVDEDWRRDPERERLVDGALATSRGEAMRSIHLGGYEVLAGSEVGIRHLLDSLPQAKLGGTVYPFRLMRHGPYHTPLVAEVSSDARLRLAELEFRRPLVTLIDGRGERFTPWSTSPEELREYTLGAQVVEPYDLTASIRVGLREHAPDRIVLPGPGNTLGGVVGQVLIAERWRGIIDKASFQTVQGGAGALVESMRR